MDYAHQIIIFFLLFPEVDKIGLPILEKALSATTIPDISGKASIGIGDVDYTLTKYE